MPILTLLLGTLAGICIATGIILLFTGLRRPGRNRVQILFALFSFSYAGANLTSILEYKATTLEAFMRIGDWTAFFTVTTLVFLLWFASAYTRVAPQLFLWGLTGILSFVGAFAIINPNSIYTEITGIFTVTLSWGESITRLDASEGLAGVLFFLSELVLIGFLIFAGFKQWRRAERQDAIMLGVGLLFLVLALIFDIFFIDTGVLNFIYLGDYGFIPLLVIMSLQLSNQVIRMDEELKSYRQNLEQMVSERTQELEEITFALRRSERQIRALLDAPQDTQMLVTLNGDILATNQIGAMRMGLSAEEAVGKNVFDIFDPEIVAERKRKRDLLLQQKQPVHWEDQRAGKIYQNSMYPILDDENEIESVAIFAEDITEQKQLQAKEKESAAMEERNRLARDLHDAVTQTIYSATLITEVLPQVWERNPEEGRRNLTKLRALVRGALAEMRTMLFELRPAALEAAEIESMLELGLQFKADNSMRRAHDDVLPRRTLFMMFFNPSLRTRNSFEAGIFQLGGHAHFLEPSATRLPTLEGEDLGYASERISDVARVLSSMGDAIAIRILGNVVGWEYDKSFRIISEFAKWSVKPVINMEDNKYHPNQGMADAMALWEMFGKDLRGRKIGVSWTYGTSPSKPIAPHHDFLYVASLFGADVVLSHPKEMHIDPEIEAQVKTNAELYGGSFQISDKMEDACENADVVYAKNYVALDLLPPVTKEPQSEEMMKLFGKYKDWIADEKRMNIAKPTAQYMHCLPCERGAEVSDAVLDGKWGAAAFNEAENRLHAQKGVMASIIQ